MNDQLAREISEAFKGRPILGVVPSHNCLEIVFSDRRSPNLLTFYTAGHRAGQVDIGGVAWARAYVEPDE